MNTKGSMDTSVAALIAIVLGVGVIAFGVYGLNKGQRTSDNVGVMGDAARSRLDPRTLGKCADWHDDGYPLGTDVLQYTYGFPTMFTGQSINGCKNLPDKMAKAREEGVPSLKFSDSDVKRCATYCAKIAQERDKCMSQRDPQSCMAEAFAKVR